MFRIGEFSRIAQTAITQLRYYDRIGLFQPEYTDPVSGYRYYNASQLIELNRILALKELGLSLDQIRQLVLEDVSVDEIRGMLTLRKAQIEQEVQQQMDQLGNIEARLNQIDQDGVFIPGKIELRDLPAQPFYGFRFKCANVRQAVKHRLEINAVLPTVLDAEAVGHFVVVLHEDGIILTDADIELGYLLNAAVETPFELPSGHKLEMSILPAVETVACFTRVGGVENGYAGYANLGQWLIANNYRIAGPIREVFIVQAPSLEQVHEAVLEIQVPVKPAPTGKY